MTTSFSIQDQEMETLVADALNHLWDIAYLGMHPLAQMSSVQHRTARLKNKTHLDDGRALNQILQDAIAQLKPNGATHGRSNEERYYILLEQAYLQGAEKETIAHELQVDVRTVYRDLVKARRVIAQVLRDWEK